MKPKLLLATILAVVMLASVFFVAEATLGTWEYRIYNNIQGNSDGYAGKMVNRLLSGQWGANIVSLTNYPPVAIDLGWTYFTAREYCGTTITQQNVKGATLVHGTQRATTTYMTPRPCTSTRAGCSLGKHELLATTISWRPEWSHCDTMP